jgi:hypothetical protein
MSDSVTMGLLQHKTVRSIVLYMNISIMTRWRFFVEYFMNKSCMLVFLADKKQLKN